MATGGADFVGDPQHVSTGQTSLPYQGTRSRTRGQGQLEESFEGDDITVIRMSPRMAANFPMNSTVREDSGNLDVRPKVGEVGVSSISSPGAVGGEPNAGAQGCLLYTSPSPRDRTRSRMPSSA